MQYGTYISRHAAALYGTVACLYTAVQLLATVNIYKIIMQFSSYIMNRINS